MNKLETLSVTPFHTPAALPAKGGPSPPNKDSPQAFAKKLHQNSGASLGAFKSRLSSNLKKFLDYQNYDFHNPFHGPKQEHLTNHLPIEYKKSGLRRQSLTAEYELHLASCKTTF